MKILVTGSSGFVGKHLIQALLLREHDIYAGTFFDQFTYPEPVRNVFFDIKDKSFWDETIQHIQPDGIIHLAAQSSVKKAWENPEETIATNTMSVLYLLDSVKRFSPDTKVITVGSSEEYGLAGKIGEALTEDHYCLPQNPYAVSKQAAGQLALQLARKDGLHVVHVRPFNHFGPEQLEGFVVSDFASQIAKLEKLSGKAIIRVGDLSARRDFSDVRDVVHAYIEILENKIEPGIYNISSGTPRTIQEILDYLMSRSSKFIEIEIDADRMRPSEVPLFIGSYEKLYKAVGWKPQRDFYDSLEETLNWWRKKN